MQAGCDDDYSDEKVEDHEAEKVDYVDDMTMLLLRLIYHIILKLKMTRTIMLQKMRLMILVLRKRRWRMMTVTMLSKGRKMRILLLYASPHSRHALQRVTRATSY